MEERLSDISKKDKWGFRECKIEDEGYEKAWHESFGKKNGLNSLQRTLGVGEL